MALLNKLAVARLSRHQERDLAALIDMYEGNYVRLRRLVPDLEELEGTVVSRVAGALDLYLTVVERFKYTTSLQLTYRFLDSDRVSLEPNARICVYHDVRCADLVSHCRRRRSQAIHPWRRGHMPELERKWEMNRFLLKWLKFCTHQGHLFLSCTAQSVPESTLLHPLGESRAHERTRLVGRS